MGWPFVSKLMEWACHENLYTKHLNAFVVCPQTFNFDPLICVYFSVSTSRLNRNRFTLICRKQVSAVFPLQYLTVKFYLHRLKHADQDDTFNTPSSSQNSHRLQKTRSSRQSRAQSVYTRPPQEDSQEAQPVYIRTP